MGVIFLFIDGIGVGDATDHNPFTTIERDSFKVLTGGQKLSSESKSVVGDELIFLPVDANLGVDGLPQSGTGQTTLFTGVNAARLAGRHFGPYPHSRTRFLLEEKSLFHRVLDEQFRPHFINAYPDIFFSKMKQRNRWTCTTLMAVSAGQKLNDVESIKEGRALTAEVTQTAWRDKLGLPVDDISVHTAARRLLNSLRDYDLVLYEYYLSDKAGHSQSMDKSRSVLDLLNSFLEELISGMTDDTTLVICSDHGNLEDLSVKTHTRNPVPFIAKGKGLSGIKLPESILDVPETILSLLRVQKSFYS